jgi:predicted dehydrogenase
MIRIGLLGASRIAETAVIAPLAKSDAFVVTAVAARDARRAREYADKHGIPSIAEDYAALMRREDVDVVYNALPPSGHAEWTIAALEAGKAVLCEKPFALNAGQAAQMVAAAERTGNLLLEAFHYRHHAVIHRARAIVASGALGRITRGEANFAIPIPKPDTPGDLRWTASLGGGALMDLGVYPVHVLRTLIGAEPEVTGAKGRFDNGVDVEMSASLRFPNGIEAEISCSMVAREMSLDAINLTLTGEAGSLNIVNFLAPQFGCGFTTTIDGVTTVEPVEGPTTYEAQLDNLRAVILDGETPVTGGHDSIANMTVVDAIYGASGRG